MSCANVCLVSLPRLVCPRTTCVRVRQTADSFMVPCCCHSSDLLGTGLALGRSTRVRVSTEGRGHWKASHGTRSDPHVEACPCLLFVGAPLSEAYGSGRGRAEVGRRWTLPPARAMHHEAAIHATPLTTRLCRPCINTYNNTVPFQSQSRSRWCSESGMM